MSQDEDQPVLYVERCTCTKGCPSISISMLRPYIEERDGVLLPNMSLQRPVALALIQRLSKILQESEPHG